MKAVILAAGRGTRMKDLTKEMPKPMLEIGGKPMLEHVITSIASAGIKDFAIIVGFRKDIIIDYFGDGSLWGVNINYCVQEVQDGTGKCALYAKDVIGDSDFMLCYGDIITLPANYAKIFEKYSSRPNAKMLMSVNEVKDPAAGAAVYVENDRVTKIIEKPEPGTSTTNLNNSGIYVFRNDIFPLLEQIKKSPRGEYELPDAFTMLLDEGSEIVPFFIETAWFDVGSPDKLEDTTKMLEAEGLAGESKGPAKK